jgi:hypothetical protein
MGDFVEIALLPFSVTRDKMQTSHLLPSHYSKKEKKIMGSVIILQPLIFIHTL